MRTVSRDRGKHTGARRISVKKLRAPGGAHVPAPRSVGTEMHVRDRGILAAVCAHYEVCGRDLVTRGIAGQWIYPKLRNLEERGYLASRESEPRSRGAKRVYYRLTQAGREVIYG